GQVEQALGAAVVVLVHDLGGVHAPGLAQRGEEAVVEHPHVDVVGGEAGDHRPEAGEDLPLGGAVVGGREDGRREVGDRAGRPHGDEVVEVGLLEGGQPGQDHVGVAGGLVQPVVDAD